MSKDFYRYIKEMNDNVSSKKYLLSLIEKNNYNSFLEIGSGGGIILDILSEKYPNSKITGTEISSPMLKELETIKNIKNSKWNIENFNIVNSSYPNKQDVIIFSSVLHEIFSYTNLGKGKFKKINVLTALNNAKNSLNDNGTILIRDGISNGNKSSMGIIPKNNKKDFSVFINSFVKDFKGLPNIHKEYWITNGIYYMPYELGREFLLTYTWGNDSYNREVNEQFGYFTKNDWYNTAKQLNMNISFYEEICDVGYKNHIESNIMLVDENMNPIVFPNTNVYIVIKNK